MTKKELMIKAHKMAKEIKAQYPEVDYKFQLGLCLAYLHEEGEKEMVELQGTEKQVAWAEKIRAEQINSLEFSLKEFKANVETAKFKEAPMQIISKIELSLEEIKTKDSAKWWIDNRNIARHLVEKTMHKEL